VHRSCCFITTDFLQDTVIATQAMSSAAGLLVDRTQDLTITATHWADKKFSRSIHITSINLMIFNQIDDVGFYSTLLRKNQTQTVKNERFYATLFFCALIWRCWGWESVDILWWSSTSCFGVVQISQSRSKVPPYPPTEVPVKRGRQIWLRTLLGHIEFHRHTSTKLTKIWFHAIPYPTFTFI